MGEIHCNILIRSAIVKPSCNTRKSCSIRFRGRCRSCRISFRFLKFSLSTMDRLPRVRSRSPRYSASTRSIHSFTVSSCSFISSRRRDNLRLNIFGKALSIRRISLCPLVPQKCIEGKAQELYFSYRIVELLSRTSR